MRDDSDLDGIILSYQLTRVDMSIVLRLSIPASTKGRSRTLTNWQPRSLMSIGRKGVRLVIEYLTAEQRIP